MKTNTTGSKGVSLILMIAGAVMTIAALALDFMGNKVSFRGPLLVIGVLVFVLGLYLYPTLQHHRKIVYIIFLFRTRYLLFDDRLDGHPVHKICGTGQLRGYV